MRPSGGDGENDDDDNVATTASSPVRSLLLVQRKDLDFTEHLWNVLKGAWPPHVGTGYMCLSVGQQIL